MAQAAEEKTRSAQAKEVRHAPHKGEKLGATPRRAIKGAIPSGGNGQILSKDGEGTYCETCKACRSLQFKRNQAPVCETDITLGF